MALVVWIFAGGGETELKGLVIFLRRNFPELKFERKTPIKPKKGPKPGKIKGKRAMGKTGKGLAVQIREILPLALEDRPGDSILVLDDLDCLDLEKQTKLFRDLIEGIPGAAGIDSQIAFAAPEIESWIVADWDNAFGSHPDYRGHHLGIRHKLSTDHGLSFSAPESFSSLDPKTGACREKLSKQIQEAIYQHSLAINKFIEPFSKKIHSSEMLETAKADIIQGKCPLFKNMYHHLNDLQAS